MKKFICKGCGYRFESDVGKKCPYCGKEEVEGEQDAAHLVEEVENILEQ